MKFEDSIWELEDFIITDNKINMLSKQGLQKIKKSSDGMVVFPDDLGNGYFLEIADISDTFDLSLKEKKIYKKISKKYIKGIDFSNCIHLKEIAYKFGSKINISILILKNCSSLKSIEDYAFYNQKLTNVDLSDCKDLTTIGPSAFKENYINRVNFTGCNNLEYILTDSFRNNELTELDLSSISDSAVILDGAFADNFIAKVDLSFLNYRASVSIDAFENNENTLNDNKITIVKVTDNMLYNLELEKHFTQIGYKSIYVTDFLEKFDVDSEWCREDFIYQWAEYEDVYYAKHGVIKIFGFTQQGLKKLIVKKGCITFNVKNIFNVSDSDGFIEEPRNIYVSTGAFYNYNIQKIEFLDFDMVIIGASAFMNNRISDIVFSNKTNAEIDIEIEYNAFENNYLHDLDLRNCNARIYDRAFRGNDSLNIIGDYEEI